MSEPPRARTDPEYDPKARARAIQSLLVEKGLLSTDAVDAVVSAYEDDVGPRNGAAVVARAWSDPEFRDRLLEDGTAAIAELGFEPGMGSGSHIEVVANGPDVHNVVVCTLCSCYPWALLGLPPTWYKTPEYRAGMVKRPRDLLREAFDLEVPEDVSIEVWDSNSEIRYMVLPQRPPGTDGLSEAELADLVTRDAMIGVDRLVGGDGE